MPANKVNFPKVVTKFFETLGMPTWVAEWIEPYVQQISQNRVGKGALLLLLAMGIVKWSNLFKDNAPWFHTYFWWIASGVLLLAVVAGIIHVQNENKAVRIQIANVKKNHKLVTLLYPLQGDTDATNTTETLRHSLFEAFKGEMELPVVKPPKAPLKLPTSETEQQQLLATYKTLFTATGADILLWGQVDLPQQKMKLFIVTPKLLKTPSTQTQGNVYTVEPFELPLTLTDDLTLVVSGLLASWVADSIKSGNALAPVL
ncbi:MAG: hypothetical protein H2174_02040 [Vampirovibrio sp.]|nr:hypothetical protein [Vampirovibrio sp.]